MVSVVKILADKFNVPDLGDRVWGTYDTFTKIIPKGTVDFYVLRHDQNRPGGFTGIGRLGTNTLGGRAEGPLPGKFKYSLETAIQDGKTGLVQHRGYAWFSGISRPVRLTLPLDLEVEYKYASGSRNSATRDGTFDQLYASNHDRFGRADLFGWRNIHNLRSLNTLHVSKPVAISAMYNNWWLASPHGCALQQLRRVNRALRERRRWNARRSGGRCVWNLPGLRMDLRSGRGACFRGRIPARRHARSQHQLSLRLPELHLRPRSLAMRLARDPFDADAHHGCSRARSGDSLFHFRCHRPAEAHGEQFQPPFASPPDPSPRGPAEYDGALIEGR